MVTETNPPYTAVCPQCGGSGRKKYDGPGKYVYGYDEKDGTVACRNCGGQYGRTTGTGRTRVDPVTGTGCSHDYVERNIGRCYSRYDCGKCGDSYTVDSSD
jgi:hypothetical protein